MRTTPFPRSLSQSAPARLVEGVKRAVATLAREWELRRAMRDLQGLDAHQLHDIGVGDGEIEHLVRNGRDRLGRLCRPSMGPDRLQRWLGEL